MKDIQVNKNGVLKLLGNLKANKASGLDIIKQVVLTELRNEIVNIVTILFQKSPSSGVHPSDWT